MFGKFGFLKRTSEEIKRDAERTGKKINPKVVVKTNRYCFMIRKFPFNKNAINSTRYWGCCNKKAKLRIKI